MQPGLRKMHGMHTDASSPTATNAMVMRTRLAQAVLAALLLAANTAQAGDAQATTVERALDLSLPRDALMEADATMARRDGRKGHQPYGSGYEARRSNVTREPVSATGSASAAPSGADRAGLRAAGTGSAARATGGGQRSGGTGGRGRR